MLTVMYFIGQQRREFRFDLRYRALTGYGRKELEKAVENEFPYLPPGSQIVLDRVAQKVALDNIRAQLRFNRAIWSGTSPRTRRRIWRPIWSRRL